jgi:hypothetical protein
MGHLCSSSRLGSSTWSTCLCQLLSEGLRFLLHLLPHALRHVLLEVYQDRPEGLRKLLLQRRADARPHHGRNPRG